MINTKHRKLMALIMIIIFHNFLYVYSIKEILRYEIISIFHSLNQNIIRLPYNY